MIVFESSSFDVDAATATRLATWVGAGGRLVFSFWDLDNATVGPALRAALEVDTPGSFNTPRSVHDDPASPVSFFDRVETYPSPMNFSNIGIDDGDELSPSGTGFVAAHLTSVSGPGAITVTHGGRVVTFGAGLRGDPRRRHRRQARRRGAVHQRARLPLRVVATRRARADPRAAAGS